ncbi:MAG: methionyl-tRNA formyltransferase [Synergistales bacterium]|nr:methionyl-tRNA formyltransferase [Synergistales bacterium]
MNRSWFAGNGLFAAKCLQFLVEAIDLDLVITSFPHKAGRGMSESKTPVHLKTKPAIPLHLTEELSRDPELLRLLDTSPPDVIFVVDFGQLIREPFLSFSNLGCLNIHPSLLPKFRGAAPIPRAILSGENATGVTVFKLVEAMDAGPILAQKSLLIADEDTSGSLLTKLSTEGSILLLEAIEGLENGRYSFREQDPTLASYAPKIEKHEAFFDWNDQAVHIHNKVRAFNPSPGAFCLFRGKRMKIWRTSVIDNVSGTPGTVLDFIDSCPVVATMDKAILLYEVQPEGKKRTDGGSWTNGARIKKGESFYD